MTFMKKSLYIFFALFATMFFSCPQVEAGEELIIAAASDLRFAMEEIRQAFIDQYPEVDLKVVYGSSGKLRAQIEHGAPFDLYFSADISYPRLLEGMGLTAAPVQAYALGRIVLWSSTIDVRSLSVEDLLDSRFKKIAIANPRLAPYGKRAKEALQHAGLWEKLQDRLVFGGNIAHTAQMVESGAADVGFIALSIALNPKLRKKSTFSLIPSSYHQPLLQGYTITKRAAANEAAAQFAAFMTGPEAVSIKRQYGFILAGEDG